jgi:hypothetical protein
MRASSGSCLAAALLALAIAGCGSDGGKSTSSTPAAGPSGPSGTPAASASCPRVLLGQNARGKAYADVAQHTGVDCKTAAVVVREWGRQQAGLGTAKLPPGWKCDASSVCRKGGSMVTLTLILP